MSAELPSDRLVQLSELGWTGNRLELLNQSCFTTLNLARVPSRQIPSMSHWHPIGEFFPDISADGCIDYCLRA